MTAVASSEQDAFFQNAEAAAEKAIWCALATVAGKATVLTDEATKQRIWDVMDYDLAQFWPGGASSAEYCVVKVGPTRVELSGMFGTVNKRVWNSSK